MKVILKREMRSVKHNVVFPANAERNEVGLTVVAHPEFHEMTIMVARENIIQLTNPGNYEAADIPCDMQV
jgi:hypothetical protein